MCHFTGINSGHFPFLSIVRFLVSMRLKIDFRILCVFNSFGGIFSIEKISLDIAGSIRGSQRDGHCLFFFLFFVPLKPTR